MYIKIKNDIKTYPYTIGELKVDNPNVSFPATLTDSVLESFGVYRVQLVENGGDYTKNYEEQTPIQVDGVWYQSWQETDASSEEIATRIEEEWGNVRTMRDLLLSQCDWTQFQDSPLSESKILEWQTYRQSLRDITTQDNPFSLIWPTRPE